MPLGSALRMLCALGYTVGWSLDNFDIRATVACVSRGAELIGWMISFALCSDLGPFFRYELLVGERHLMSGMLGSLGGGEVREFGVC